MAQINNQKLISNSKTMLIILRILVIVLSLIAIIPWIAPTSQIFFSLCASINNPAGQRFIAFGINVNNLTAIFFAIILIVIGQVMKLGQKISEEQELTI